MTSDFRVHAIPIELALLYWIPRVLVGPSSGL